MRILAVSYPKNEKDERKLKYFNEHYDKSLKTSVKEESDMVKFPLPNMKVLATQNASLGTELRQLIFRNERGRARDPMQSRAKIGQQVIFSLIVAAIFYKTGFQNPGGLEGKVDENANQYVRAQQLFYAGMQVFGALFFITTNLFMGNFFNSILVF